MTPQHAGDVLQIGRVAAMRQEQGLALGRADARMVEVDVDHRLGALRRRRACQSDQERAALLHGGHVAGLPAALVEEQILVPVEPEQRDRLERAVRILAEEDRIFALDLLELGREDQHLVDAVAERRPWPAITRRSG